MEQTPTPETQEHKPSRRKRWGGILQIAISLILLFFIFRSVGFHTIIDQLASVDVWLYAAAGLVLIISLAIRAIRWQVLLTPLGVKTSLGELFYLYMVGFFWNSFLPSGFGGDVVKAIELRRMSRQGSAAVVSVVAERMVGLLATALIGLLVIAIQPRLFPIEASLIVAGMCVAIVILIAALRLDIPNWLGERLPFLKPIVTHKRVLSLHDAIRAYRLRDLGWGLLASVPFTLASILDNYLVGLALGIDLSIGYYALYTPIISIIGLLPISFNGLGVREYTYQVLFGLAGVSPEKAIAMAFAFNLLRFGAGLLGGLAYLIGGIFRLRNAPPLEDEKNLS